MAHHKHILNEMDRENRIQVEELKSEADDLQKVAKQLRSENLNKREKHDELVWDQIDKMKDKNKEELTRIIEAGM
jgi:hypothetical protein